MGEVVVLLGGVVVVEPGAVAFGDVVVEPGVVVESGMVELGGLVVPGDDGAPGVVPVEGAAPGVVVSGMVPGAVVEPGAVGVPGVGSGLVPGVTLPGLETPGDVAEPGVEDPGDVVSPGMADGVPLGEVVSGVTVVAPLLLEEALPLRWCRECCVVVVPGLVCVLVLGVVVWALLPVVLEGVCAVALAAARNANERAVVARGFNIRIGVLLCRLKTPLNCHSPRCARADRVFGQA